MKVASILGRIVLTGIAYVAGVAIMSALAPSLHLPTVKTLPGLPPLQIVLASPILGIGLLPLAASLTGSWLKRCSAIAVLIYVTLGLNTLLEMKIFSGMLDGNPWLASLEWILPSFLAAGVVTYKFGADDQRATGLGSFGAGGWAWRILVAWLAFPVIYFFFGACVGPIVIPYYRSATMAGQYGSLLGLHIPATSVIFETLFIRSATFLAGSLPAIALWTRSRGRLFFALGAAHAVTVGIFGLAVATFFPMAMRLAHGVEITCDSFAYAAVLALLFAHSAKAIQHAVSAAA